MKSKKIAASILAFSLITSAAASNTSVINKIIPVNTITAEAAISSGDWEFKTTSNYTAEITGYKGQGGYVIVPEAVKDPNTNKSYTVTSFGTSVFYNNTKVTSVAIPRGVTEIPNNMFCKASNLSQVYLPHGIKKIGTYAFAETPKLTSISLPNSLQYIDTHAFRSAGLTSVTFPSSLTTIRAYAFTGSKLTSVTLPSTLQMVENDAFSECLNLVNVTINCNCNMGRYVFYNNKITNVNISTNCINKVLSIGALAGCTNLKKINNIQILNKTSDGKPYFDSRFNSYITQNFAICEDVKLPFMEEYIKAMVKYVVKTETAGCTDAQKIRKLHDWVCNKVDYAFVNGEPDPSHECHVDSSVFFRNTTVCDGYARALTLLLREAGLEAYYIHNSGVHAWCMVKLGNRYFHIDACHDGQGSTTNYSHYLKSDNNIKNCQAGHNKWTIYKPSSRFTYTIPSKTPVCSYSLGDVNMDGTVNKADSDYLIKIIAKTAPMLDKTLTDVNGDGVVDVTDASFLRKLY